MTTPNGTTVSSVKINETTVAKTGHWTYSKNVLTFKSSYLATLDDGDTVFTVTMSNGDTVNATITIEE